MKFTTKKQSNLLEAIMEAYKGISKQKAKQMLGYSAIFLNGQKIEKHPQTQIPAQSLLEITDKSKSDLPTKQNKIVILFEDNYYIIGIKPAGILAANDTQIPTSSSFHKILENFLSEKARKKVRLWVVHRLDRNVEGLIIFAKTEFHQQLIKENWTSVTKKYLALTENKPENEQGTIESWLMDTATQKVISFPREREGAKFAKTEFLFLRPEKRYFLLEMTLHTGRKNQIRVHLAQINCPIVGDRKYGADASFDRQIRLAAYKLDFLHPVTSKPVQLHYTPSNRFFNPSQSADEKYKVF